MRANFENDFNEPEIQTAIQTIKNSKITNFDEVYPELFKHYRPKTCQWLVAFFKYILHARKFLK